MTGLVCLQGGNEFTPGCRAMDKALLDRVDGPIVVSALAGAVGRDYRTATDGGVAHFRALGASEVIAAPDVREDQAHALEVLRSARLLVLPGGSPSRLLTALMSSPVGAVVAELLAEGAAVMGASAGAMVLCPWTVLPDRRGPHGFGVARGLGVVPDVMVIPHWSGGSSRGDWLRAIKTEAPADVLVIGVPEESGVIVESGTLTAVGQSPIHLVGPDRDLAVGQTWGLA